MPRSAGIQAGPACCTRRSDEDRQESTEEISMTNTSSARHIVAAGARALVAALLLAPAVHAAELPSPVERSSADAAARRVVAREELGIDARVAYAGDRVIESTQAGRTITLKERRMPGKARLEFEQSGQQIVMILDETAAKAWMLLPLLSLYTEVPVQDFQAQAWESLDLLDFEKLDRETVNGHAATRFRIAWADANGNRGHGFHWVTDDGVPIRLDVTYDSPEPRSPDAPAERVVAELRNLEVAPQDPALFALPAGYVALPSLEGLLGAQGGGFDLQGLGNLLLAP
jgi:hypothetical protein